MSEAVAVLPEVLVLGANGQVALPIQIGQPCGLTR